MGELGKVLPGGGGAKIAKGTLVHTVKSAGYKEYETVDVGFAPDVVLMAVGAFSFNTENIVLTERSTGASNVGLTNTGFVVSFHSNQSAYLTVTHNYIALKF